MKFYNREKELQLLHEIEVTSREHSQMTVLVGRRRIGKTKLLLKAIEGKPSVYLFASRKSESILCQQFVEEVERSLNMPIGRYTRIAALLEHLMRISKYTPFTLIIDEFQELEKIDSSIIGDIQRVWDLNKDESRINLLLSGSVYSMMKHIFEDAKEPLFSRASHIINLKAFSTDTLKTILADFNPHYTQEDLLALYMFTGGVAWYVELLMTAKAWTWKKMIEVIFQEQSLFINEGKNLLIEEIGKEYSIYFSILECISRGINTRGDIENATGVKEIGGYLSKLEKDFGIIAQLRPIFSKPASKTVKYTISDNFLTIWFRFFYKYMNYVESDNFTLLRKMVKRDYQTCSGIMLERYFRQQAKESGKYTDIGQFWDKKGQHEIDIILVNEQEQLLRIGEIKRQAKNIDFYALQNKIDHFLSLHPQLQQYTKEILTLSMKDM
jgi:AAA+ ATPase superfamily predicted ATPase